MGTLVGGKVLDECAPEGHVHQLEPATDRHGRQLAGVGTGDQVELEPVALIVDTIHGLVGNRPVPFGVDVPTTGEEQAIDVVEHVIDLVGIDGNQDDGDSAAELQRVGVRVMGDVRPGRIPCGRRRVRTSGNANDRAHGASLGTRAVARPRTSTTRFAYPLSVGGVR